MNKDDKDTIVEQLNEYRERDIQGYRKSGFLKEVGILAADDSCDTCKSYHKTKVRLENTPVLPIKDCKRDWCRCTYIPIVD
jgi:hypothetical protein